MPDGFNRSVLSIIKQLSFKDLMAKTIGIDIGIEPFVTNSKSIPIMIGYRRRSEINLARNGTLSGLLRFGVTIGTTQSPDDSLLGSLQDGRDESHPYVHLIGYPDQPNLLIQKRSTIYPESNA